jgi:phosphoserine phosphatase
LVIATLIAVRRLDERLVEEALARLPGARLSEWIDQGDAADIQADGEVDEVRNALEGWEGIDVIAHPPGPREKKLLVADMDSTMIGQECIDELADYAGVRPRVAEITDRAMHGELDFAGALKERVALLEGLGEAVTNSARRKGSGPIPARQR